MTRPSRRAVAAAAPWGLVLAAAASLPAGCAGGAGSAAVEVAATRQFDAYDRVAIWANLNRQDEELFIPLYMNAFPSQTLVERRDVEAILGEQDILPDRLDESTRARLRRILGVKALVYPSATTGQVAIKVVDTETGAISASVVVTGGGNLLNASATTRDRLRRAVAALEQHRRAERAQAEALRSGRPTRVSGYGG
jgi:hypothetical protein